MASASGLVQDEVFRKLSNRKPNERKHHGMSPLNQAPLNFETTDPRDAESIALREIAQRMITAQQEPVEEARLLQAVRLNWRLWTIFQTALLHPSCGVPVEVRNNILALSNFVDRHTADIVANPTPSKLDILIRINHNLADGLRPVVPI